MESNDGVQEVQVRVVEWQLIFHWSFCPRRNLTKSTSLKTPNLIRISSLHAKISGIVKWSVNRSSITGSTVFIFTTVRVNLPFETIKSVKYLHTEHLPFSVFVLDCVQVLNGNIYKENLKNSWNKNFDIFDNLICRNSCVNIGILKLMTISLFLWHFHEPDFAVTVAWIYSKACADQDLCLKMEKVEKVINHGSYSTCWWVNVCKHRCWKGVY